MEWRSSVVERLPEKQDVACSIHAAAKWRCGLTVKMAACRADRYGFESHRRRVELAWSLSGLITHDFRVQFPALPNTKLLG